MSEIDADMHRRLGVDLYNSTWTLIDKTDRDVHDEDFMVDMAHASAYHWRQVGEPVNFARSHWQLSRVYALIGAAGRAVHHGRRCLEICEDHGIADFDLAYAHEALARAYAAAGEIEAAHRHVGRAQEASLAIADAEDRKLVEADLATIGLSRP